MILDGLSLFRDYQIPYTSQSKNLSHGWVGLRCPFCRDNSDHLGFSTQSGAFSCWKCGPHRAFETLGAILGMDEGTVRTLCKGYWVNGVGARPSDLRKLSKSSIELPKGNRSKGIDKFLAKRMITQEMYDFYDLRDGGVAGDWAYRLVIPIYYKNKIVSATGRAISKEMEIRYKTLPYEKQIVDLKTIFFGLDDVPADTVIVVEGPLDAIRGGPGFIASFGSKFKEEQITLLSGFRRVFFLLDNDEAGIEASKKYAHELATMGVETERITLEDYKDIGETPDEEIESIRRELGFETRNYG